MGDSVRGHAALDCALSLLAPHFWERRYAGVTAFWSLLLAIPFLYMYRGDAGHHLLAVVILDYVPFLCILWALYTVASGIFVTDTLHGTPLQNTLMLAAGGVMASWIGTTGASIVLVRPLVKHRMAQAPRTRSFSSSSW